MQAPTTQVTAAEISRLAGVTRATVSNWRRRHPDFPAPVGGTDTSPAYDLVAVRAWLATHERLPERSPADELRDALRGHPEPDRFWPAVLAVHRLDGQGLAAVEALSGTPLIQRFQDLVRPCLDELPEAGNVRYVDDDMAVLQALLRCVREDGTARAIEVVADSTSDAKGEYVTPADVASLMADLLKVACSHFPQTVFDPACGIGNLLVAAAERGSTTLVGQEIVTSQAQQAAVRLAVTEASTTRAVHAGDSLRDDAFPDLTADAVLCAPPFGNRDWGADGLAYDSRWVYGLPSKIESELAWVQHCLAHLRPAGPAVMLMPPSAASRSSGRRIRGELVRAGALRAVVALPPGVASRLAIGVHVWVLGRPEDHDGEPKKVLFVDTDSQPGPQRHKVETDWSAIHRTAVRAWSDFVSDPDDFTTSPGVARAISVVDLLDESVDLSPIRHVATVPTASSPREHASTAHTLRRQLQQAATGLATLSAGDVWPPSGDSPRTWRHAAVSDLLRGGALTLLRTAGHSDTGAAADEPRGQAGDVVLPEATRYRPPVAHVIDAEGAGQPVPRGHYLLRPDPRRLDPWFLAGFLTAPENVHGATTGTSLGRLDVRRLRIPLLPLDEQRRYGRAFRYLHTLRRAADLASRLADDTARELATGLTTGALQPPDTARDGHPAS